jgi:hypothetical protein
MIVNGTGSDAEIYQVYFQLNDTVADKGVDKTWYKLVNGEFKLIENVDVDGDGDIDGDDGDVDGDGDVDLNDELKLYIAPALLYANGMTYYHTDIEHLKTQTTKTYGVVRNHIYDININSISGLGTPVADPNEPIVPEKIEEETYYVAAQVQILKWKMVSQSVDLN